jgi:hypothetical protein
MVVRELSANQILLTAQGIAFREILHIILVGPAGPFNMVLGTECHNRIFHCGSSSLRYALLEAYGASGEDLYDSQMEVPAKKQISALFNKTMNKDTINAQTFTLKEKSVKEVPSTVILEGANAILRPNSRLNSATQYIATISRTVMDIAGNSMADDVEWSFTT